jgi:tRNA (cytidine/uridine-2'-O-)-methyltransferase
MHIALFEPDIPQNTGSLLRLAACMDTPLHIIEPCGFPFDDKRLRRAALDYYDAAQIKRHISWHHFLDWKKTSGGKLLLLSTHAATLYTEFAFASNDVLLLGRESSGVPGHVRDTADQRLKIPMREGLRSLNVALAASMVLGEAIRQTKK